MKTCAVLLLAAGCTSSVSDDPSAHVLPVGLVELTTGSIGTESPATQADAMFAMPSALGIPLAKDGACTKLDIVSAPQKLVAGAVHVTSPHGAVTLTPNEATYAVTNAPAFEPGDAISFDVAAGSDVGAVSGTVAAPEPITGFVLPTTFSRRGLSLTWDAGDGNEMWAILSAYAPGEGNYDDILCRIRDDGSYTIAASTFALLSSTDTEVGLLFGRVDVDHLVVGGKSIDLDVVQWTGTDRLSLTP